MFPIWSRAKGWEWTGKGKLPDRVRERGLSSTPWMISVHPLVDVEFAVLDLETGSPATDQITEVGVVKVRGGEVTGTFHTLVNPGMPIRR